MGRKREITGKAVIYTPYEGVKVLDAEVRREFNCHGDGCTARFDYSDDYLPIGCARTVVTDNHYAMPAYNPNRVQQAVNYGESRFFRFMLELMRLAQWQPVHKVNSPLYRNHFTENRIFKNCGIDFSKRGAELDKQLYDKHKFTPAMIKFIEDYYNDELLHKLKRES